MAVKTEMPSKVTIIQRFENPWLRPGEFTIRLSGRAGRLNFMSKELVDAIERTLISENGNANGNVPTQGANAVATETNAVLAALKRDPSTVDLRWFRFKRRVYHPELGGKKTLVTALTPFDFTQMVFGRGRRGHQMAGFFHPKIISINRPPTKAEWIEVQTLAFIERNGQDPTPADIKQFKRSYRSRPPLGPEKQRWVTLWWMPTDTIQGAEEIRHRSDLITNVAVLSSKLMMKEGPKIAQFDQMKAQTDNILVWRRDVEQALHKSNVELMKEAHTRMELQEQSAMEGVPRFVAPVFHEFPQMPTTRPAERRFGMPSMPDFGRFMPLMAVVVGIALLLGGIANYMQTANMPTRSGFEVAALGGIIMLIGMVLMWAQSRQGQPTRITTTRPLQMPMQTSGLEGRVAQPEEKEHAS